MKGVFKCAREDDKKIQECQTLKLGDAPMHPQEIFKGTQASKLGDAPVHPLLHQHYQFVFRSTIFLSLHVLCAMLGASCFQFPFQFSLAFHNESELSISLCGRETRSTSTQNITQNFHVYLCCVCSLSFNSYYHVQLLVFMLIFLKSFCLVGRWNSLQLSCLSY